MSDYTSAQRTALINAIASGVLTVHYENGTTTYRSLAEMERVLTLMDRDLADATNTRTRMIRVNSKKNL